MGLQQNADLNDWHEKFKLQFNYYFSSESEKWNAQQQVKRCRDINYYVDIILDYIHDIDKKKRKKDKDAITKIKEFIDISFVDLTHFKCERKKSVNINDIYARKKLDDYCENRDYLINNKSKTNASCKKLDKYVYDKYNCFFNYDICMTASASKEVSPFHISNDCTFYDIRRTFPYFYCNDKNSSFHNFRIPEIPVCSDDNISESYEFVELEHRNGDRNSKTMTWDIYFYGGFTVLGIFLFLSLLYRVNTVLL